MSTQKNSGKLKLKSALKKPTKAPEKLDIQTTLVKHTDLSTGQSKSNDLDSLLSSMSQKYTYGYVAPKKPEPVAEPPAQGKDKKKKSQVESVAAPSKSKAVPAMKVMKKAPVDDNSDWSDDFEEEVAPPAKKAKHAAKSTAKPVSKPAPAPIAKKAVKKVVAPVEDDNSDWSEDFEVEDVPAKNKNAKASQQPAKLTDAAAKKPAKTAVPVKAAAATKPTPTPAKAAPAPAKTATKSKEKPSKKAAPMDMGMFMSADAMLGLEYEEDEDDGEERVDEFASMYGGDSDDEEDAKEAKEVKNVKGDKKGQVAEKKEVAKVAVKEKEKDNKTAKKTTKDVVEAPVQKAAKTKEPVAVEPKKADNKDQKKKPATSIFADADDYNIDDMSEGDDSDVDDEMDDEDGDDERNLVFGAFGSDSEDPADEDAEDEDAADEDAEDEDEEMAGLADEDEDMLDMDSMDGFEGEEDMDMEEDEDEFEWVEEGEEDMQLVDNDDDKNDSDLRKVKLGAQKLDTHMTITACDALEAALALAQPARVSDKVAGALLGCSEVGRSGLLAVMVAQLKHAHSQTDVVSKLLFLSELCRYNTVKDLSKTFHSLTDTYLRDNEFNNFEQWLLTARFTSLLSQPLPATLPAPDVRKVIAKMLTKGKASLTKLTYASPLPVNLPVVTEEQRERLQQQQQMSLLSYATRQQIRQEQKLKNKQTIGSGATIQDALLPQGPAVAEHLKFAKMLISRGATPEAAVSICNGLNAKIVNNVMNIVDGGPYNAYGGDVKCEEIWSGKVSEEEVLWGWPQHAKATLSKKIRLSAGKVSVILSLLHFIKLAILYFNTMKQSKAGLGVSGKPFGEADRIDAEEDASANYVDVGPYLSMVLQALPVHSTFRTVLGDIVRVGTLTGNKFISNFRQMSRLMKLKAWYDQNKDAKADQRAKHEKKPASVPPLPDLQQFMLSDVAAQAALAANNKAVEHAPILLPLPRHFLQAVMTTVLRYQSLQGASTKGGGNQASLTHNVFKTLQADFGVMAECFASPLNCYFSKYCSAFPDTDAMFGSMGSFFQFTPTSGSYQVNPPFDEDVILASALHIEQLLARATKSEDPLSFVVIIPENKEENGWKHLQSSDFCAGLVTVPARQHAYYEGLQQSRKLHHIFHTARHATSVFILQNAAAEEAWPVTEEKVQRLVASFQKQFELPQ